MLKIFIFHAMLFFHILADYNLQGLLADFKQRGWWQKNAPDSKYKYDYITALIIHSISWTFMIMLPIALYLKFEINWIFIIAFVINTILHGLIDDIKANKKKINLSQDQIFHIIQIIITVLIFDIK